MAVPARTSQRLGKGHAEPGDVVTTMGYQFTDGQKILRLQKIVIANGKEMFLYGR